MYMRSLVLAITYGRTLPVIFHILIILNQSWSWVTFSKPNPTQNLWIQPNPTYHRHLVWHIRLYRKLYRNSCIPHPSNFDFRL